MWQRFLAAALLECVTEEKLPILPTIIHLEQVIIEIYTHSQINY